ncbi:MAG: hypothetical protein ACTSRG_01400 [Candidatus Helarchaeota archaeon]
MKFTDFYLLEVIAQISYILIIASVIFFVLAIISENNTKIYAIIGGATNISVLILFVISIFVGSA